MWLDSWYEYWQVVSHGHPPVIHAAQHNTTQPPCLPIYFVGPYALEFIFIISLLEFVLAKISPVVFISVVLWCFTLTGIDVSVTGRREYLDLRENWRETTCRLFFASLQEYCLYDASFCLLSVARHPGLHSNEEAIMKCFRNPLVIARFENLTRGCLDT
jgi:hypothetical protein